MADISVKYLGLDLKSPVVASSSPLTATADKVVQLARHGVGAVVLKSIFEEQIMGERAALERYGDYPEAADYLREYAGNDYMRGHLDLIAECKARAGVPVIASVNCSTFGGWTDYARRMEAAGADAIELNIFLLPTDPGISSTALEERYLAVVADVVSAVGVPVSVKLGIRFTNILAMARQVYFRGGRGVVLFNRFFEPDIDIEHLILTSSEPLSAPAELRNSLRTAGLCSAAQPGLDISLSTGVHSGPDAVKALLAGARTVQVCSTLYENGLERIGQINDFISDWMERNSFACVADFCGRLDYKGAADNELYQRAQFMRYFPG